MFAFVSSLVLSIIYHLFRDEKRTCKETRTGSTVAKIHNNSTLCSECFFCLLAYPSLGAAHCSNFDFLQQSDFFFYPIFANFLRRSLTFSSAESFSFSCVYID